jgi:hypothetical protein
MEPTVGTQATHRHQPEERLACSPVSPLRGRQPSTPAPLPAFCVHLDVATEHAVHARLEGLARLSAANQPPHTLRLEDPIEPAIELLLGSRGDDALGPGGKRPEAVCELAPEGFSLGE